MPVSPGSPCWPWKPSSPFSPVSPMTPRCPCPPGRPGRPLGALLPGVARHAHQTSLTVEPTLAWSALRASRSRLTGRSRPPGLAQHAGHACRTLVARLTRQSPFGAPIVTEIVEAGRFFPAEENHRAYFQRNPGQPYCRLVVSPKVAKFRKQFPSLVRA